MSVGAKKNPGTDKTASNSQISNALYNKSVGLYVTSQDTAVSTLNTFLDLLEMSSNGTFIVIAYISEISVGSLSPQD
jgi:hypothetical protein